MSDEIAALARRLWNVVEPVHAVVYFADEVHAAYRDIGLRGFWMGYFAGRAHPLGAAPPELVTATFFNFHPAMVERAIPDAWTYSSPHRVGAVRHAAVNQALGRLLGDLADGPTIAAAAGLAAAAVEDCDPAGRALYGAHAALSWPDDPLLRLWHACTLLREHRGDGHVAANLAHGLSGLDAHVLVAADGPIARSDLQPNRGWSDDDWIEAEAALTERGLLAGGQLTARGRHLRIDVEATTDRLAAEPVRRLGADRTRQLIDLLHPLAERAISAGGIPVPNPMGVPWPPP
ncbi:MAG TPA: hypothetical protein VM262_07295 [Acidimicrobiales bacterium]|nr:hypothetical protein [Acidimicrobiales bacterium]